MSWWSGWAIPGLEFAGTRHNVGAEAVAALADRHRAGSSRRRGSTPGPARSGSAAAGCCWPCPQTYMNDRAWRWPRWSTAEQEHSTCPDARPAVV